MTNAKELVKSGWIYTDFNVVVDPTQGEEYCFIEVWNEKEDANCDAYPVKRYMRIDFAELAGISKFIRKNDDHEQFTLERCAGGPLLVAVEMI